jgi:hypothetical protein
MKKLFIILAVIFNTGCATLVDKICKDALITEKVVQVDPRALEECKELVRLPDRSATFSDVLTNTTENAIIYYECKSKQRDSILLIKRFANIKDSK